MAFFSTFVAASFSTTFASFSSSIFVKERSFRGISFSIISFALAFAELTLSFAALDDGHHSSGHFSCNGWEPRMLAVVFLVLVVVASLDGRFRVSLAGRAPSRFITARPRALVDPGLLSTPSLLLIKIAVYGVFVFLVGLNDPQHMLVGEELLYRLRANILEAHNFVLGTQHIERPL